MPLTNLPVLSCTCSERRGGAPGILADEIIARSRPQERSTGHLRVGAVQQPAVHLLRDPSRRQLLRKFPELPHKGRGETQFGKDRSNEFRVQRAPYAAHHRRFHREGCQ